MRRFCVFLAAGLVLMTGFCGVAYAQLDNEFTDGVGNGFWNEDGNWTQGTPTDEHNAIIPNGLTCVIPDSYSQAVCSRFTITGGAVLEMGNSAVLTVAQTHGTSVASGCKVVLGRSARLDFNGGGVITLDGTIEDVNSGDPENPLPAQIQLFDARTYVVRGSGGFVGNFLLHISHSASWDETLVLSPGTGIYGTVLVRPALINLGTVNPDNVFSGGDQTDDVLSLVCRPKIGTGTWRSSCTDCSPEATNPNKLEFRTPILGTGNLEATRWGGISVTGLTRVLSLYGDFEITGDGAQLEVWNGVVFDVDRYETLNCP